MLFIQDVKKLWKAGPFASSSGFGILRPRRNAYFALSLARRRPSECGSTYGALSPARDVSDWRVGGSEK